MLLSAKCLNNRTSTHEINNNILNLPLPYVRGLEPAPARLQKPPESLSALDTLHWSLYADWHSMNTSSPTPTRNSSLRLISGLCLSVLLMAFPLAAQESIFVGIDGNASFTTPGHWDPSGVPAAGTDIRTNNTLNNLNWDQIRVQSSFSWGDYIHETEIGETSNAKLEWIWRGAYTINLTSMTTAVDAIPFMLAIDPSQDGDGTLNISGDLTLNSAFIYGRYTVSTGVASFNNMTVSGTTTLNSGGQFAVSRIVNQINLGNLVMNGGTLDLTYGSSSANGTVEGTTNLVTVNRLSGSTGTIRTDKANTFGLLRVDGATDGTYDGTIVDGAGGVSLTKAGTSILTLTGTNTYTGATIVEGGVLALSTTGTIADSAEFEVWENALLSKTGDLTLAQDVVLHVGAPGDSGRIATSAELFLNGSNLEIVISGLQSTGSWQLFDFDSYDGNFSSVLLSGSYSGALSSNGDLWEGTLNERDWVLDLNTGALSVIPEPRSVTLVAALLCLLVAQRRMRRNDSPAGRRALYCVSKR